MAEERRMITDDEAEVVCRGIEEYLDSLDYDDPHEIPATDIFGQMLFLFARKCGHIDNLTDRQVRNLTESDKRTIEAIWENGNF
jgi:hypothetical protein